MFREDSSTVHRLVQTLFDAGMLGALSDGQLLAHFADRGDEVARSAFAILVQRHGPMVLGVCRRILRDSHHADDAFQATFLVLARRANEVRVSDSLGRWLYGVSRRVAVRAKANLARRAVRETSGLESAVAPAPDPGRDELLAVLDEEIARLPERYREAVVLCDLEGMTHEAAARQLRRPVGTIESRLSRGRGLLRARLTRRGLAPSALMMRGALLSVSTPAALAETTIQTALQLATGRSVTAGIIPASVLTLSKGALREMTMMKLRGWALAMLGIAVACGLGVLVSDRLKAADSPKTVATSEEKPEPEDRNLPGPSPIKPGDELTIQVLQALPGRPIQGTKRVRPDGTVSLEFYGDLKVAGLTRDQIKVKLIERLRKYLSDEVLGLVEVGPDGKPRPIDPLESNRVFVDDSSNYGPRDRVSGRHEGGTGARPADRAATDLERRLDEQDRRLREVERKLEQVLNVRRNAKPEPEN